MSNSPWSRLLRKGWICLLGALALLADGSGEAAAQDPDAAARLCATCHRAQFDALTQSPHGLLARQDWLERSGAPLACLSCHVDASEHIQSGGGLGGVFAFRAESPAEQTARCTSCHTGDHAEFTSSLHGSAGLTCSSCHQLHGSDIEQPALLRSLSSSAGVSASTPTSSVCLYCHAEVSAQFAFTTRHRIEEGVLDCTSCHDPHQSQQRPLLGGLGQQSCVECHSDKSGPFVFEHPTLLVEGCTACHTPHGSPNRHLLIHQQTGELCLTCHVAVPQFHLEPSPSQPRFGLDTQCTNCHVRIHGSNFDPHFLR